MTRRDDTVVPFRRPELRGKTGEIVVVDGTRDDLFDRFVQDVEIDPHSPMMRHILRARETNRTPTKSPEPVDRHRMSVPFDDGGIYQTRDGWTVTDITHQIHGTQTPTDWRFQGCEFRQVLARPGKRKNDGRHWWRMARLAALITSGVIGYGLICWGLYLIF